MQVLLALIAAATALWAAPWQDAEPAPKVRFTTVDLYVDAGATTQLAAWQVEFAAETGDVKLVGIEGGGHEAYADPPYYDPEALQGNRVVLAAFSTDTDRLPVGKTRVATLHLQVTGDVAPPTYVAKVIVAADAAGAKVEAEAEVVGR